MKICFVKDGHHVWRTVRAGNARRIAAEMAKAGTVRIDENGGLWSEVGAAGVLQTQPATRAQILAHLQNRVAKETGR